MAANPTKNGCTINDQFIDFSRIDDEKVWSTNKWWPKDLANSLADFEQRLEIQKMRARS